MIATIKIIKFIRKNIFFLSLFTLIIYLVSSIFYYTLSELNNQTLKIIETLVSFSYLTMSKTESLLIFILIIIISLIIIEIIIRKINYSSVNHIFKEILLTRKIRNNFTFVVEDDEVNKSTVRNYNNLIKSMQIFITKKTIVVQISANAKNDAILKLKEKLPGIKEELSFSNDRYIFSDFERVKNKYVLKASRKFVKSAQRR